MQQPMESSGSARRFSLSILRWNIPWLFWIGYTLTVSYLQEYAVEYTLLTALAFMCSIIILTRLTDFRPNRLAAWLVFAVFLAVYYLRFYWIVIDPTPAQEMLPAVAWSALSNASVQVRSFALTTYAFVTFSLGTWAFMGTTQNGAPQALTRLDKARRDYDHLSLMILLGTPVLMGTLGYLTYHFSIGLMGALTTHVLPFRLAGIIFYSNTVVIPVLLLLEMWAAERSNHPIRARMGLSLLLLHGASEALLYASRGAMLTVLAALMFFVVLGGFRPRRSDRWLMVAWVVLSIAAAPLVTIYRALRVTHQTVFLALSVAPNLATNLLEGLAKSATFILFRIPGIEMLMSVLGLGGEPLGSNAPAILFSPRGVAGYLTVDIFGFPPLLPHTNAPAFLGWLYLVGGTAMIVVGLFLLSVVVTRLWFRVNSLSLFSGPVVQAMGLLLLFSALAEGTLETIPLRLFVVACSIVLIELMLGRSLHRRSSSGVHPVSDRGGVGCWEGRR